MVKKGLILLVVLAAAAMVAAANPDSVEVEKAERFRAPQPDLELIAPQSCEAPEELETQELSFEELVQSQNASSQLNELGARCIMCTRYGCISVYC